MAKHLQQVRLSASVESAHPRGRLNGGVYAANVGFQNTDYTLFILAFADKMLQFIAQGRNLFCRKPFCYGGNAIIEQLGGSRIALKKFTILHGPVTPLCSVLGT